MIDALLSLARQRHREGATEEALSFYRQAADMARGLEDSPALVYALRHASDLERERGNPRDAATTASEAIAVCTANPVWSRMELANAFRLLALARADVNETDDARSAWQSALALYEEAGIAAGAEECRARLASAS